jgi:hypothetical protein
VPTNSIILSGLREEELGFDRLEISRKNKPERRGAPENYRFETIIVRVPLELKAPEVLTVLTVLTELTELKGAAEPEAVEGLEEPAEAGARGLKAVEARSEPDYSPAAEAPRAVPVPHFPERPFPRPDGCHPASCDFRRPSSGRSRESSSL